MKATEPSNNITYNGELNEVRIYKWRLTPLEAFELSKGRKATRWDKVKIVIIGWYVSAKRRLGIK